MYQDNVLSFVFSYELCAVIFIFFILFFFFLKCPVKLIWHKNLHSCLIMVRQIRTLNVIIFIIVFGSDFSSYMKVSAHRCK